MVQIARSDVSNPKVIQLFSTHDDFMLDFLGEDKAYYTRYNQHENIQQVWLAIWEDTPVGCVAYREKLPGVGEIKRMFIAKEYRGRGISKSLLATVETYATQRGDHTLHLSTRVTLEPAVTLYRRCGFIETLRNGLYIEMEKKLLNES